MIEAWADNLDQQKFVEAFGFGMDSAYNVVEQIKKYKYIKTNVNGTEEVKAAAAAAAGTASASIEQPPMEEQSSKTVGQKEPVVKNYDELFQKIAYSQFYDIFTDYNHDKMSRDRAIAQLQKSTVDAIIKSDPSSFTSYDYNKLSEEFYKFMKKVVRNMALDEGKRVDGRKLNELRDISCKVDMYKALHGSALFQRGQTQVLASVTLDSDDSMYRADTIFNMMSPSLTNFDKNFMLHYEFPSSATNEIARVGGKADRREIGHGALAGGLFYRFFLVEGGGSL
jgi:polyribonucleotide nucleotidyltransferase